MRLSSEMKNLSSEILNSFKQRIKENEELVNNVQKTLDKFHQDHQEMAAILNAKAGALRKGLADEERERLSSFHELMTGIHGTISTIQKEVMDIQTSTFKLITEFSTNRSLMAKELNEKFQLGNADRKQEEQERMLEFNAFMKNMNAEIKSINDEVLAIFKNTNDMIAKFEKEHQKMSAELRTELGNNLDERVKYTRTLLRGFHEQLTEIGKKNKNIAKKLHQDLANGEAVRLNDYKGLMKEIHSSIKGIQKGVKDIQKATSGMISDYGDDRKQASAEWKKMQDAVAQMRETDLVAPAKGKAGKIEKKKAVSPMIDEVLVVPVSPIVPEVEKEKEIPLVTLPEMKSKTPMTLDEKVLDYINRHPKGVKISEMEEPLGESRMKLGFIAKVLLDDGKVQKVENVYFPLK